MGTIDLQDRIGLPLQLTDDGKLLFGPGLETVTPAVRRLDDIRDVLEHADAAGPDELYDMYRDVAFAADRPALQAAGLRYDITVIRPGHIGRELVKTAGHYHPEANASGVTYPEIYEVATGQALFLLQQAQPPYDAVTDAVAIAAGPGDRLLVPPGYGHITVNTGLDWLVLTNIVDATFASVYEPIKAKRGGAYYVIRDGGAVTTVPNEQYDAPAPLRERTAPQWPELGIAPGRPLYTDAVADPDRYRYVTRPGDLPGDLI